MGLNPVEFFEAYDDTLLQDLTLFTRLQLFKYTIRCFSVYSSFSVLYSTTFLNIPF